MLLAAILEAATGQSADQLLENRILQPIGIQNSTYGKIVAECHDLLLHRHECERLFKVWIIICKKR